MKREWITSNIKSYFLIFFHVVISYSYWCHDPRKKLSKSNARVFLRSILFKDADQVRYKSPYKKLGRSSKSLTGGLDSRAEIQILAESFKQDEAMIFINIIMISFICLLDYFKDQIWWNPRPDIWIQEPRPRKCRLIFKTRHKPSAGYQDPRSRVSNLRPDVWNSDTIHDVVIC